MGNYDNFVIQKGATWERVIRWQDSDGNPIDITGYSAKLQISTDYETAPSLTLTSGSGITITGAQGKLEILATATQTNSLSTGYYVYELELISGATVNRIMEGQLYVSPQVSSA